MSLQEEIENHLLKHYNAPIDKNASYLINTILDAAVEAIHEEYPEYHEDAYICIQAINKLRGGNKHERDKVLF